MIAVEIQNGMKKCSKCKKLKLIENFHKNLKAKAGLNSWCKDCYKQSQNKYQKTEKGKSAGREQNYKFQH